MLSKGLLLIVPIAILLTVSYVILVVNEKLKTQSLKTFGVVVIILLWLASISVLVTGSYMLGAKKSSMKHKMMKQHMMKKDKKMGYRMDREQKPECDINEKKKRYR